jgi:branched-chain amino acid transport system permease protein
MDFIIDQTFCALSYAALLFLIAAGFTLILGIMTIVNVAHGSFYLVGGYIGYTLIAYFHLNFYLAILGASLFICMIGIIIERVFLRRMEGSWTEGNDLRQMLVTMGIALILHDTCLLVWGGFPLTMNLPRSLTKSVVIGGFHFSAIRLLMILAASVIFLALQLFIGKTTIGAKVRAAMDNSTMAGGIGINVSLIKMGVFALGAFIAAIGGVIGGAFMSIYPGLDFEILPFAFVVVVLGGMGSLKGALIGSIAVGLIDNFGKALVPQFAYFTLFAVLALVLAFKPTGFFGKE